MAEIFYKINVCDSAVIDKPHTTYTLIHAGIVLYHRY